MGAHPAADRPVHAVRRHLDARALHQHADRAVGGGARRRGDHLAAVLAVVAEIGIGPNEAGGFALEATLRVHLGGGIAQDAAEALTAAAHQVCPYSNATRGNVPVTLITTVS